MHYIKCVIMSIPNYWKWSSLNQAMGLDLLVIPRTILTMLFPFATYFCMYPSKTGKMTFWNSDWFIFLHSNETLFTFCRYFTLGIKYKICEKESSWCEITVKVWQNLSIITVNHLLILVTVTKINTDHMQQSLLSAAFVVPVTNKTFKEMIFVLVLSVVLI